MVLYPATAAVYPTVYPTVYLVATLIAHAVYPHVKHAIVTGLGWNGPPLGTLADRLGSRG
jgi:hypothetical protein